MKTNVAGLPWGWKQNLWDSRGNAALFDVGSAHAATKNVFKLPKDVFCDFILLTQTVLLSS